MQLDWHDLKINGCPAFLRALKQIETTLTQQEAYLTELQYLMSEELMINLTQPAELRGIVDEHGYDWRIERQPSSLNGSAATSGRPAANPMATTAVAEIEQQIAGAKHILDSFYRNFVHSPGYPADDGEV